METFSAEEVEILNQGGELPENLEAGISLQNLLKKILKGKED